MFFVLHCERCETITDFLLILYTIMRKIVRAKLNKNMRNNLFKMIVFTKNKL